MLNIVKLNLLNKNKTQHSINEIKTSKHFPSSTREWINSIYVYNENNVNLIPNTTISTVKIIKGYFSLYNQRIERKMRTKRLLLRFRRLSSNKIYVSNGEFKHTNNKVVINLYLFNRQKYNYMLVFKKLYLRRVFGAKQKKNFYNNSRFNRFVLKKSKLNNLQASKNNSKSRYIKLKNYKAKKFIYNNKLKRINFSAKKTIYNKSKNFLYNKNKPKKNIFSAKKTIYNKSRKILFYDKKISYHKSNWKKRDFFGYTYTKIKLKAIFAYKQENLKPKYKSNHVLFSECKLNKANCFNFKNHSFKLKNYLFLGLKSLSKYRKKIDNNKFNKFIAENKATLKNMHLLFFLRKPVPAVEKKKIKCTNFNRFLSRKIQIIRKKSLLLLRLIHKEKYLAIKTLAKNKDEKLHIYISAYISKFYNKFIKKSLKKLKLYFYYRQLIYINRSKYNYTYLQYLNKYLYKLYNKNIEYNLINLKRFYLHSDILSESLKLKLNQNRKRILRKLKTIWKKIKTRNNKIFIVKKPVKKELDLKKNSMLCNKKNVINNLKYKYITGFRLQARGRLTRRYTASRSIVKTQYKGNLLNVDSSYKGLSSVLLKGNVKSNLQYTKLKSKSRIGSFGIKGWVSGT